MPFSPLSSVDLILFLFLYKHILSFYRVLSHRISLDNSLTFIEKKDEGIDLLSDFFVFLNKVYFNCV